MNDTCLRAIFDTAHDAMLVVDESSTIVMANASAARMHRCTVDDLLGTPMQQWVSEYADEPVGLRADGQQFPEDVSHSLVNCESQGRYLITLRDVTAAKQMQAALESSKAELRRLVAGQQQAEEDERKRIARELHDDLQQTLAALRLSVLAIDRQAQVNPAEVRAMVAPTLALAEAAIQSTRRMVSGLRPQLLDDFGLKEALTSMLMSFGDRTGVDWDLDISDEPDVQLPPTIETGLFRVAQESLQNIEKHARASFVQVSLDLSTAHWVVLQLQDDGVGIDRTDLLKHQSFGLLGMEERVRAMGGTLRVTPGLWSGTLLEAVVPLPSDELNRTGIGHGGLV